MCSLRCTVLLRFPFSPHLITARGKEKNLGRTRGEKKKKKKKERDGDIRAARSKKGGREIAFLGLVGSRAKEEGEEMLL